MSISALIGSLGFGYLAMKYRIRYLAMGVFVIQILAMILVLTTRELGLIFLFSVMLGISYGSLTASLSVFVGEYFPREYYPQVLGIIFPFQIIANASSASLAGVIFDKTSSYTPAFIASLCFSVVGLFFSFLARRPEPDQMMV
jgi:predicted MFS family arabinose efflux permease